jgi:WD40 repeat protein
MEEIANQQKLISDEQREAAIEQRAIAETERQNALEAEQKARLSEQQAKASEQDALEARNLAELQRTNAERQRAQADYAKRVADTLSFKALGRSLAALSHKQFQLGNTELANLLAYAAYRYTRQYGQEKDLYNPTVLQALMESSRSVKMRGLHNGTLTCIDLRAEDDNLLVTVSNYGEVMRHRKQGDRLLSEKLFSNSQYDFRHVYLNSDGYIYAVSRTGDLIITNGIHTHIKHIEGVEHPSWIARLDDQTLVLIGERELAFFDMPSSRQTGIVQIGQRITASSRTNNHPLIFDDKGCQYEITGTRKEDLIMRPLPKGVTGTITAFANSKNEKLDAYGTSDGRIYLVDSRNRVTVLTGHRSRISKIRINGKRLYSSSYDGTLNLWMYENAEPISLFIAKGWITYFTADVSKHFMWTGDQFGNLTEVLTSIPLMASRMEKMITRDLSPDEWNYYIGTDVPYESFKQKRKEGGQ